MSKLVRGLWCAAAALVCTTATAEIHGEVLGTGPPPSELGGVPVVPFDLEPQAAIPDFGLVLEIPGGPTGPIVVNDVMQKLTVPTTFPPWSHGYTGPVFVKFLSADGTEPNRSLTLPEGTRAFYLYVQTLGEFENVFVRCGDVLLFANVEPKGGATGFGFYTDDPEESLPLILISRTDWGVAELGIGGEGVAVELESVSVE